MKIAIQSFIAGFLSTLVFHQGAFALLYLMGIIPMAPYNLKPVPPLGVPSVISLAFFGGLWGILIWQLVRKDTGKIFWVKSVFFGGLAPTLVAFFIVFPFKGIPQVPMMLVFGLLLNGIWGFGNSLFVLLFKKLENK